MRDEPVTTPAKQPNSPSIAPEWSPAMPPLSDDEFPVTQDFIESFGDQEPHQVRTVS